MKTKLFLAAVAVTFSFAMMSCTGNKTTNAASEGEETTVETVEAVVETDSCCHKEEEGENAEKHSAPSFLLMKYRPVFVIYFW